MLILLTAACGDVEMPSPPISGMWNGTSGGMSAGYILDVTVTLGESNGQLSGSGWRRAETTKVSTTWAAFALSGSHSGNDVHFVMTLEGNAVDQFTGQVDGEQISGMWKAAGWSYVFPTTLARP
jgi:hypothetical protein